MILDDIFSEIEKIQNICILAHENPDGDAIGSSLGLYHVLKEMGKNPEVLMKKVPSNFSYMPEIDSIKSEATLEKYDMTIVVDCPELKRINSDFIKYFDTADVTVEFDHHLKNAGFADYNVVNHASPACAQILISSLDYLEIELSKESMTCFLTGIITDTGGFKNSGTSVETFEIAERALEKGINLPKIYKDSMLTITRNRFEFQKLAMERMEFFADGKIAFTYITKDDDKVIGIKPGDHEGIVEIGRNIEGVEVSIFIHEDDKGYKVSTRSNEYVDVSDVCMVLFGGGGHIRAAGATSTFTFEETKQMLIKEITKKIK